MNVYRATSSVATVLLFGAVASVAVASNPTNAPRPFVTSSAGQFSAYSPDAAWSSVLCVLGSQVKREWLKLLDLPDKWRDPIILVVTERPVAEQEMSASWLEVLRTDLHLKFQIQLSVPPPLQRSEVVSALVQALCSEYANREREFPRRAPVATINVPPWLVEGLAQNIAGEPDKMLPILRRSVNSGRPPMAEDLIKVATVPVETGERLRFRAHSWALVESLLSLPKGSEKLCQLIREPETFAEVYRWQFRDDAAREKWWSLRLAERATTMMAEDWSAAETGRRLAAILPSKIQMQMPDAVAEAPVAFVDLGRYTESAWLAPLLRDKLGQLSALHGVAHPFYRAALERYSQALQYLLQRQTNRFRHETKLAQREHAAADEQAKKIREYVDQMERIHAPPSVATVSEQLKLLDALQEMELLRRDPIGDYLDKFDK